MTLLWSGDSPCFIHCLGAAWFLKYQLYVYPSEHNASTKKPSPIRLYEIRCLSLCCPWKPISYSSILILFPRTTHCFETHMICFNTGSIFQFGWVLVGGIGFGLIFKSSTGCMFSFICSCCSKGDTINFHYRFINELSIGSYLFPVSTRLKSVTSSICHFNKWSFRHEWEFFGYCIL